MLGREIYPLAFTALATSTGYMIVHFIKHVGSPQQAKLAKQAVFLSADGTAEVLAFALFDTLLTHVHNESMHPYKLRVSTQMLTH